MKAQTYRQYFHLLQRGVYTDENQPSTAKPVQDWGDLVLVITSTRPHSTDTIRVSDIHVLLVSSSRDFGVFLDPNVRMNADIGMVITLRSCFAAIRQLRSVCWLLPRHALLTPIRALVVSEVNHCNSILTQYKKVQMSSYNLSSHRCLFTV